MYYYFDIDNIWARIRQYVLCGNYLIHKSSIKISQTKKWRLLVMIIIISNA